MFFGCSLGKVVIVYVDIAAVIGSVEKLLLADLICLVVRDVQLEEAGMADREGFFVPAVE